MKPTSINTVVALACLIPLCAFGQGSALRIVCTDDNVGAEIRINGKFRGECPVDLKVAPGRLTISATKGNKEFSQELRVGEDSVKKIEVILALSAAAKAEAKITLWKQVESGNIGAIPRYLAEYPNGRYRAEVQAKEAEMFRQLEAMVSVKRRGVHEYAIGKYEVTQGLWQAVMGNNPSDFKDCGATCPVETVTMKQVREFIHKLNARTGKNYCLPTQSQWREACRGNDQWAYCGNVGKVPDSTAIDAIAWHRGNSGGKTHPVGQKQPNSWGLFDMQGNVREWVDGCGEDADACNYIGSSYESPGDNKTYVGSTPDSWSTADRGFRLGTCMQ